MREWMHLSRKVACARTWEIEAARDGRLSDPAKATLDRHLEQCAVCRKEMDYFEGLSRGLRAVEVPDVDDIALRRLRQSVLQRFDAELAGRNIPQAQAVRPRRAPFLMASLALAAALVTLLLGIGWRKADVTPSPALVATTTVDATGEGDARWTKRTEGETERVDLSDGTLRLRVSKAPNGRKVIVRVPDGEIEDLGTVFYVVVGDGVTRRVGVDEGRVTIRLTNAAPITLASGQTWERAEPSASLPIAPARVVLPSPSLKPPVLPASAHPTRPATHPQEVSSALAVPAHGDEEDAAYLRAVGLVREGRENEARAAAREYLRRFPDGFRREEIGRIAK